MRNRIRMFFYNLRKEISYKQEYEVLSADNHIAMQRLREILPGYGKGKSLLEVVDEVVAQHRAARRS